jgi:serine/threonine protein kinase
MIGKTISHYKILEKLGEGGMGVVYKVQDTKLDRLLALKFLPPHLTVNDTDKARFLQEAKAAAAINHPNVCTIYDIKDHEEQQFIVMEYVDGKTLREYVGTSDPTTLKIKDLIEYALQIAAALEAAHEEGIVHRDIKSENIMVSKKSQIKVMDFGLAKLKGSLKLTKTSSTVGTLAYMAPEQIEGKPTDARSDIFSFGVVLYEMLTGKLPFSGEYESALMYSILNEDPKPVQKFRSDVSSELIHVLNRALEKDPEDRYPNMKEILIDLKRIKRDTSKVTRRMPVQTPETEEVVAQKTEEKPIKKSKRYLFFSGAALSVLIIFVVAFLIFKPFTKEPKPDMNTKPFTSLKGVERYPSFSPDGNNITFCWDGGEGTNSNVYIQQIDGRGLRPLTDHQGNAYFPVYSPDGLDIAYLFRSKDGKESGIYKISALGDSPQKLHSFKWFRSNISWSPGGKFISYSEMDSLTGYNIYLLSLDDRKAKQLTTSGLMKTYGDYYSVFSPKGKQIAFVRQTAEETADIYIVPITGEEPERLTYDNTWIENITWTPDGRDIIFSSDRDGARRLWRISKEGGEPEPLEVAGANMWGPAISKDGRWLAFYTRIGGSGSDIWRVKINDSKVAIDEPVRLIASNQGEWKPFISPDGSSIAFLSNRSGQSEIWKCDSAGGNWFRLTYFDGPLVDHPRWSPDGKYIAFNAIVEEQKDIFVVPADGGKPINLTKHKSKDTHPFWSNDGQWIYFESWRSGEGRCWKIPWQGGTAIRVTDIDAGHLRESPDGKWLYYRRDNHICRIPIEGGEEQKCFRVNHYNTYLEVFENGIFYKNFKNLDDTEVEVIEYFSLNTKNITTVFESGAFTKFDISPDCRWLIYSFWEPGESDIYLVENWR